MGRDGTGLSWVFPVAAVDSWAYATSRSSTSHPAALEAPGLGDRQAAPPQSWLPSSRRGRTGVPAPGLLMFAPGRQTGS